MSERMLADGAGRSPEWTPNAFLLDFCRIPGKWAALRGDPPPQRVTSGFGRPGLFVLLGACFLGI